MRTLKTCLLATALMALAIPAANAAGNDPVQNAAVSLMHNAHAPTDAVNDVAQGGIDIAEGNVGQGARGIRDGVGCLFIRAVNVGMTLGVSLFDEDVGTHDPYYRSHCIGHENDGSKTLAKLGVPAGSKIAGNMTVRDLAGTALDAGTGVAMFSSASSAMTRMADPAAAVVGDVAATNNR